MNDLLRLVRAEKAGSKPTENSRRVTNSGWDGRTPLARENCRREMLHRVTREFETLAATPEVSSGQHHLDLTHQPARAEINERCVLGHGPKGEGCRGRQILYFIESY